MLLLDPAQCCMLLFPFPPFVVTSEARRHDWFLRYLSPLYFLEFFLLVPLCCGLFDLRYPFTAQFFRSLLFALGIIFSHPVMLVFLSRWPARRECYVYQLDSLALHTAYLLSMCVHLRVCKKLTRSPLLGSPVFEVKMQHRMRSGQPIAGCNSLP